MHLSHIPSLTPSWHGIFRAAARALRRRKPTSSVLPEKEYDEPPDEPPVIIIIVSIMISGDMAPPISAQSSNMVPKNLAVRWSRVPAYLPIVVTFTTSGALLA